MESVKQILQQLGVKVTRLVTDSRAILPGDTFVAYPGEKADGRHFIAQAISRGANAVIWESQHFNWDESWDVPNVAVADLRHHAGELAHEVYGCPSEQLFLVGVTGTNGKTSSSHWIAHVLNQLSIPCGLIGTLGNGMPGSLEASANTTPEAIKVHGLLAGFNRQGLKAVAMEVSSHALAQGRVNGVHFDTALLTNLSRDHLDYHGDMEHYANSKRRLFDWQTLKHAVVNLDDMFGAELADQLRDKSPEVIGYGLSDNALRQAERLGLRMVYGNLTDVSPRGLNMQIHSSWGGGQLQSNVLGRFNAANLLGVLAVLLAHGLKFEQVIAALSTVKPVAGRMQRLGGRSVPTVIVDYAHTPDALEKVLSSLREAVGSGLLLCVFGCGGDRDKGKRALMGRVAEKLADYSYVTSDNPRSEDPQAIVHDILNGMNSESHQVILDRRDAIRQAINMAEPHDIVLVAGKGHENYQEIKGVKHPFSDVEIVEQVLQSWRKAS